MFFVPCPQHPDVQILPSTIVIPDLNVYEKNTLPEPPVHKNDEWY